MVDKVIPEKVIGYSLEPSTDLSTNRNAQLYALGIAYSQDPLNIDDQQYTYENHESFKIFPTFCTVLPQGSSFELLTTCPGMPPFNPMRLLHGEQRIQILRPIKSDTKYITKASMADVADKGKNALITVLTESYEIDEQGKEHLAFIQHSILFIRDIGGFGFKGQLKMETIPSVPQRAPCNVVEQQTYPNQAMVYRLSGDYNPLHVDPQMAAIGGFEKPILHGLCSYGMCAKVVAQQFCNGDGNKIKQYNARFQSHVFPGETLLISMWKNGNRVNYILNNKIIFVAKTKQRQLDVISGVIDLQIEAKL